MRLIDADELFAEIKARHDMFFLDCEYIGDKARRDELGAIMGEIINAPTVGCEHEPAEVKTMGESKSHGSWWYACGACGHAIDPEDNFCRECGRKVKWE